ncbi:hypothetical protein MJ561_20435 [Klebsiella pneumoniae]|nr:hypothetical protein MJ561_20435 [Klebsiella pneumoniae]
MILDEFPHMAGTASSLAGTFRFGIRGDYRRAAVDGDVYHRTADADLYCLLRNLLYFLLALRIPAAKNRTLGHISGRNRPFLDACQPQWASGFCDLFRYVKSIVSVKSRIVAIKKLFWITETGTYSANRLAGYKK